MATVNIPTPLRSLTGGETKVTVPGGTLREVIDALEAAYPGLRDRLVEEDRLRPGLAVFIDGDRPRGGLDAKVGQDSEVYFAPAIAGGSPLGARASLPAKRARKSSYPHAVTE